MTEDNVLEIAHRLRDGRPIRTEADWQQWFYEFFDKVSQDFGTDHCPHEIFPAIVRVMVEWVEVVRGADPELDLDTARALASAVSELTTALRKYLDRPDVEFT
jgi:hypothetical protein